MDKKTAELVYYQIEQTLFCIPVKIIFHKGRVVMIDLMKRLHAKHANSSIYD